MDGVIKQQQQQQQPGVSLTSQCDGCSLTNLAPSPHQLPGLNNQVLLRELRLDDNSISSLEGLADCWLPLLELLSVAQNR